MRSSSAGAPLGLEVRGLSVSLGGRRVLEDVGLSVPAGRFCAIVGPNGSGKTTLVRALYRGVEADRGEVRLGEDLQTELTRPQIARRVAVLRQEPDLAFAFSARELVAMGRSPYRGLLEPDRPEDREVVQDCLRICDVEGLAERDFSTLSGGEKQRVLLARALAQAPGLLLLDEPTNHLDLFHQLDILERVRGLGCTVVAALHALELADRFADQVLVLDGGRVEASGAPEVVREPERIARVFGVRAARVGEGAHAAWSFALPEGP